MRILVTGGAGFIGSQIVDASIAAGHDVEVIDNMISGRTENINPAARLHAVDVRDRDAVERVVRQGKFDLINHHAAQLDVRVSVRNPQFDAEQNVIGSLNMLQAAHNNGVERFIFASSGGTVYGEQEYFPADEKHPLNPVSPYGVTKLCVEKYLHYYRHQFGLRYITFRYTNVYGPRQNPHGEAGVVAIFCDKMLDGLPPMINGTGEQSRDYVHVADIVDANMLAAKYLAASDVAETMNIASGRETTVVELFDVLNALFDNAFAHVHAPAKPGEQMRSLCTAEHAQRILGWRQKIGLEDGLRDTLAFFRTCDRVGPPPRDDQA